MHNMDEKYVGNAIKFLYEKLDHVLISEYIDESLILLKDLMTVLGRERYIIRKRWSMLV